MSANDSPDMPRFLVLGAGAIGSFYGSILAKQHAHVTMVCRSDYALVKSQGYLIKSASLGDHVFIPNETLHATDPLPGAYPDYVIVSLKVVPGVNRVALLRPVVGPNTTIFLIENGVEIEQEILAAFPNNPLISSLAFVQVSRVAPGVIQHFAFGQLTIGNFPNGISPECRRLADIFEAGGIPIILHENITQGRWQKVLWNAPFNPVSVLGGVVNTFGLLHAPGGEDLIRELMAEVMAVAKATGHEINPSIPDQFITSTKLAPPYKTSMAIDWERHQDIEVEAILGNTILAAQREHVAVPRLEQVQTLVHMMINQRKLQQI